MKKTVLLFLSGAAVASVFGQAFVAGLDFETSANVAADIVFDTGGSAGDFTLIIQDETLAEDGNPFINDVTDEGWAAVTDTLDQAPTVTFANPNFGATVSPVSGNGGFSPNTELFGETSLQAQGFSNTFAIDFLENTNGFFSIQYSGVTPLTNIQLLFGFEPTNATETDAPIVTLNGNAPTSVAAQTSGAHTVYDFDDALALSSGETFNIDLSAVPNGGTFDNFMVAAVPVPEPAALPVLFGLAGLLIARRRA